MIRILITLALLALMGHSGIASVLSFVKNDVYSLKDTNKATAILNDKIESDSQVGTGEHSMCEIS